MGVRESGQCAEIISGVFAVPVQNSGVTDKVFAAAYMTGILPIRKNGSQSAISDFKEFTMVNPRKFANYTGFTEEEVFTALDDAGYGEQRRREPGMTDILLTKSVRSIIHIPL